MRSTPLILDRLRHIRYDLQSMWDMDHLIEGGLVNILDKKVSFDTCQTLLWFGLLAEDPDLTKPGTQKLMTDAGIDESGESLIKVFSVCITELFNSGVFETPAKQEQKDNTPVQGEGKPAPTMRGYILELVKLAYLVGVTDPGVIWKMTPAEIEDLAYTLRDRMQGFNPARPQTPEEMLALILSANAALGGADMREMV